MALIDKLSAIGDAIREKTGKEDLLTLDQMPTEIQAIETGGGDLPEEALIITGNCNYRFANNGWNWFIENYGNKIITKDIDSMMNMFESSSLEEIPFELNGDNNSTPMTALFRYCNNLISIPKMNKIVPYSTAYMFYGCHNLKEIPDDIDIDWDWSYHLNTSAARGYMFSDCYSLRKYPNSFLNHGNSSTSYTSAIYNGLFTSCYVLDEVIDLPMPPYTSTWSSNVFTYTIQSCFRLKNFTFTLQEDGTPYQRNWRNQTLDCSSSVGWANNTTGILNFNSGITEATRIVDDESYQLLKDHPDSWTTDVAYSRYNHDSAVATINSLPDCSSASGTNIIKFKGPAGSKTDGGAINTLTAEELAVATAKKWTVSYVS